MIVWLLGCHPSDDSGALSTVGCAEGDLAVVAGVVGVAGRNADGLPATETWLSLPQDVTPLPGGGFFIDDYNNHVLREVGADGISRVVAGSGFPGGGEGGPALQEPLDHPTMALLDPRDEGMLWFAATGNHRVGRLDRAAARIDFPYGSGFAGFAGDGGPGEDAWFHRPSSLAFDDEGVMYVSDRMNQVVRAIDADGLVSTVAGTSGVAGYAGDGGAATEALLNAPPSTETDPGNRLDARGRRLVLADTGNNVVREVDLDSGVIQTIASDLSEPHDVAIGPDGVVYVADSGHGCVLSVDAGGDVATIAGVCGSPGAPEDGLLDYPVGVAVDDDGNVWIADRNSHVIARTCPP